MHLQLSSCLNSLKTTEGEKEPQLLKLNLPHNKGTTAVETIPKIQINGYKLWVVFGKRAGNRKIQPVQLMA